MNNGIQVNKGVPVTFLVESQFTAVPTADILTLIPAESVRSAALDAEGVRLHLFVAADQSKAWQVYRADSLAELEQILATLPCINTSRRSSHRWRTE
jgi:muconolactone delta-isomerase